MIAAACSSSVPPDFFAPTPATRGPSAGGGFTSSSSSGDFDAGPNLGCRDLDCCNDERPFCVDTCCAPGWRCIEDGCVAPGIRCESDGECGTGRRCEPTIGRCLPGFDAGTCTTLPDPVVTRVKRICYPRIDLTIENRGLGVLPAGVPIAIRSADAGPYSTVTPHALVEGESVTFRFDDTAINAFEPFHTLIGLDGGSDCNPANNDVVRGDTDCETP
jgi:hypothetical protein